mmetsp:Transcript_42333/g.31013  ORF Transcript_42333/g.31013 Transcript_42333/m.31013 type:complete len:139 (-) Transcript_42333:107-523(-)
MLLPRYDLAWFDIQIEQRVATLKANIFVGVNLGQNLYKVGFMCLIGIAHLPEGMNKLRYYRTFEVRPTFSTNLMEMVSEEMSKTPKHAGIVSMNLFWAVKMICDKVLFKIPISGNIEYEKETRKEEDDEEVVLEEQEK